MLRITMAVSLSLVALSGCKMRKDDQASSVADVNNGQTTVPNDLRSDWVLQTDTYESSSFYNGIYSFKKGLVGAFFADSYLNVLTASPDPKKRVQLDPRQICLMWVTNLEKQVALQLSNRPCNGDTVSPSAAPNVGGFTGYFQARGDLQPAERESVVNIFKIGVNPSGKDWQYTNYADKIWRSFFDSGFASKKYLIPLTIDGQQVGTAHQLEVCFNPNYVVQNLGGRLRPNGDFCMGVPSITNLCLGEFAKTCRVNVNPTTHSIDGVQLLK